MGCFSTILSSRKPAKMSDVSEKNKTKGEIKESRNKGKEK
jgi:hypothetical protein